MKHAQAHIGHYGRGGMISFRKHLAAYVKGMKGAKKIRQELMQIKTIKELEEILKN